MRRHLIPVALVALVWLAAPGAAHAQWVVHDPTNYAQAILRYRQLIQQYQFMLNQARRLPVNIATRYGVPPVLWRIHDVQTGYPYARPMLMGLNYGDPQGTQYARAVDALDVVNDVLTRLPASLRQRVRADYGAVELADSVATMGIHQSGAIRFNGRATLQAIDAMEQDAASPSSAFHTQTALLNKINSASVLGLRLSERTNQFLLHTLEQLIVDNTRAP